MLCSREIGLKLIIFVKTEESEQFISPTEHLSKQCWSLTRTTFCRRTRNRSKYTAKKKKASLLEIRTRRGIGCAGQTVNPVQRIPEVAGYEARTELLYSISYSFEAHLDHHCNKFFKATWPAVTENDGNCVRLLREKGCEMNGEYRIF